MARKRFDGDGITAGFLFEPYKPGIVRLKPQALPEMITWLRYCSEIYERLMFDTNWTRNLEIRDRYIVEIARICKDRVSFISDLISRLHDNISLIHYKSLYRISLMQLAILDERELQEIWFHDDFMHGEGI